MKIFSRLKQLYQRLKTALTPGDAAWRFSVVALLAAWLLLLLMIAWPLLIIDFTVWKVLGFAVAYVAMLLVGLLVFLLIHLLVRLPRFFTIAIVTALPLLALLLGEFGLTAALVLYAGGLLCIVFLGGTIGTLTTDKFNPRVQKVTLGLLTTAVIGLGVIAYFSFIRYIEPNPAFVDYQLENETLDLPDPSLAGEYEVRFTTYGSGSDRHRSEFGEAVGFRSTAVDGSKLIDNWESIIGWSRTGYWGFDSTELPVQARVWYPADSGIYPLVLIVHGNHAMEDFSDPGYEYLGQLLASRGYIFASVDENFLNSSIGDMVNPVEGGLEEENDARGWMLLEHLRQWRDWNSTQGHLFHNKVDMRNISLIGHSRGGEAVAIASYFNQLSHYPDNGSLAFDYDFNIRGIISIAPVDGQYEPRNFSTPMQDTNYFVIHGSTDGDVRSFAGIRQFNRAQLNNSDQFKAALYVLGANHGQFNSSWGNADTLLGWSLRKASIMPEADQRKIAEVYFSAFLDITHKQNTDYLPLFQDARFATDWLPNAFYVNNFQKLFTRWLANFEEDGNLGTGTLDKLVIHTRGLSKWSEVWQGLKYNVLDSHVLALAWDERFDANAELVLELATPINLSNYESLSFTVSQNTGSTLTDDFEAEDQDNQSEETEAEEFTLLDWSIVLEDANGNSARRLLSSRESLYPQIKGNTLLAQYGYSGAQSEAVMKYYSFELDGFEADTSGFNRNRVSRISFLFDQSERGSILVDDIGLQ
ncbi:MAG: hypothetical protein QGG02_03895 [Gammaproteobacteria bacterium]|jgi:hypothetical protein|nr:hypothetical protein [Gammaproteobacteria bacterium]MDP6731877.1 hypothetical protein [Gammaproteobacteria bacterium]